MILEDRYRFIRVVERLGYTVEATEHGNVMILTVWGSIRHVARSIGYGRYDWEEIARQFAEFQQSGGKQYRTAKVERQAA